MPNYLVRKFSSALEIYLKEILTYIKSVLVCGFEYKFKVTPPKPQQLHYLALTNITSIMKKS